MVKKLAAGDVWLQAAEEAASVSGGELQQVAEQLAALDAELTKQGGTQAPTSKRFLMGAPFVTASLLRSLHIDLQGIALYLVKLAVNSAAPLGIELCISNSNRWGSATPHHVTSNRVMHLQSTTVLQ